MMIRRAPSAVGIATLRYGLSPSTSTVAAGCQRAVDDSGGAAPLPSTSVLPLAPTALSTPVRFLKIAKSVFGFYLGRQGQRKYPFHRRPHWKGTGAMNLNAPYYWSFNTSKSQCFFLPEENYITGDWTGKFFVSKRQVYTLQHATSGAKCRVKRFPSVFEFNNPSRWNIGKELVTLAKPRMDLIDEQMLTKKQRLDYVKAGLLPK